MYGESGIDVKYKDSLGDCTGVHLYAGNTILPEYTHVDITEVSGKLTTNSILTRILVHHILVQYRCFRFSVTVINFNLGN